MLRISEDNELCWFHWLYFQLKCLVRLGVWWLGDGLQVRCIGRIVISHFTGLPLVQSPGMLFYQLSCLVHRSGLLLLQLWRKLIEWLFRLSLDRNREAGTGLRGDRRNSIGLSLAVLIFALLSRQMCLMHLNFFHYDFVLPDGLSVGRVSGRFAWRSLKLVPIFGWTSWGYLHFIFWINFLSLSMRTAKIMNKFLPGLQSYMRLA